MLVNKQVLFDRITWNREVVVQEASPLMFFFIHYAVYGYRNANRPILFFYRECEVCRLDLIFLFTDTATEFTEQAAAVLLAAVPKIFLQCRV